MAWLLGLPAGEVLDGGALLGTKLVLNELIAYIDFSALPPETFTARSRVILTYALCGFANFAALGIMIGGLITMAPERRQDIISLSTKSLISGTLSNLMTGAVVGVILSA